MFKLNSTPNKGSYSSLAGRLTAGSAAVGSIAMAAMVLVNSIKSDDGNPDLPVMELAAADVLPSSNENGDTGSEEPCAEWDEFGLVSVCDDAGVRADIERIYGYDLGASGR